MSRTILSLAQFKGIHEAITSTLKEFNALKELLKREEIYDDVILKIQEAERNLTELYLICETEL